MKYSKIAVIPARSGSKGIRDKNIIPLCGKPLISYSIEAALDSGLFSDVIVTTDSQKYARIAEDCGAAVMMRDSELASDDVPAFAVIEDVLKRFAGSADYFALLQPTSPMRSSAHILEAAAAFEKNYDRFDFLVAVTQASHAGILVKPIGDDGSLKYFDTDFSDYKRQAYKEYSPNGSIFIGKSREYLSQKHFFGKRSMAYKMSRRDSVDIDDEYDLQVARMFMEQKLQKHRQPETADFI